MKILISIPAYNEEKTIGAVLIDIKKEMEHCGHEYSIQVIDDGSTDKTVNASKKYAHVISHRRNLGLAEAFRTEIKEFLKSDADIFVHTDADGQYPSRYIPQLIAEVEKGADLVLGSRFSESNTSSSFIKKIGNIAFAKVFSRLLKVPITDSTTGFRAFTTEVASSIEFVGKFTYTQEQLIKAARMKFRIKEIPIKAQPTRESRLFSNPLQYAWKAWINIFRIYRDYDPLAFFGSIGLSIFSVGFLIGLFFIYINFTTGISGHTGLLFLMTLSILTGIQIILFGFLADMNRKG